MALGKAMKFVKNASVDKDFRTQCVRIGTRDELLASYDFDALEFDDAINMQLVKCQSYEQAEALTDSEHPDPILRWNTCARLQEKIVASQPAHAPLTRDMHSEFGEDVPPR